MNEVEFVDEMEEMLVELQERNPRFHGKAYLFLLSSLHQVMESLERPRHISGPELADGVRRLALHRFGPMARTVLQHWGIHSTEDMGDIVFTLVDLGVLIKEDDDLRDDFRDVFDFEEVFEENYPWGASL